LKFCAVIVTTKNIAMNNITITNYEAKYQPYFERLNRQWIEAWFTMEPLDEYVLTNPEEAILKDGGAILMALYDGSVAGTVGLRKVGEQVYEFTKMAVDENFRRKGIAEALSYASFEKAKELGATKVILYSNTKNANAIKLYEKIGFKHLPVEPGVYERANVKMEIDMGGTTVETTGQTGMNQAPVHIENLKN
jgi:ribosomal protein S18 acetylase RimI-like enzyme